MQGLGGIRSVGQGALGIEARRDDRTTCELLAKVAHVDTQRAVLAERGVLEALGADCKTPLGAYAERIDSEAASPAQMRLRAFVCKPHVVRHEVIVPWPATDEAAKEIGAEVGAVLLG